VVVVAFPARAQADWFLTPFIGLKFAGDTQIADLESGAGNTKPTYGGIIGFLDEGFFGLEADVGYSPRFFERSSGMLVARSHVLTIMGNVVLAAPTELTGDSLRPFVSGGAGLMHSKIDDVADVLGSRNSVGINIGGGATGRLTDVTSLRFELRYFRSLTNEDPETVGFGSTRLSFWRAGVGLTLRY
jgi:opacity protein-like surface antigen